MDKPSIIQRQALGSLFSLLTTQDTYGYGNYYWDDFSDWEPIKRSQLSFDDFFATLNSLPRHPKRLLVQSLLLGWNKHHNLQTLYNGIKTLIYYKVCGVSEYFLLQVLYNLLSYYSDVCSSKEYIEISSYRPNEYRLRFWKDNSFCHKNGTNGMIEFQSEDYGKDPVLAIVPWYDLICNKNNEEEHHYDETEQEDYISEIFPIINNEFVKDEYPYIYSDWDLEYRDGPNNHQLVIIMHSLKYVDNNDGKR